MPNKYAYKYEDLTHINKESPGLSLKRVDISIPRKFMHVQNIWTSSLMVKRESLRLILKKNVEVGYVVGTIEVYLEPYSRIMYWPVCGATYMDDKV